MAESRLVDELAVRAEVEEAFEKEILMTYHLRRNVSAATAALSALASARNATRIPVDIAYHIAYPYIRAYISALASARNATRVPVDLPVYSMPIYTSIIHAWQRCIACAYISAHSASAGNATRIAVYKLI